MVETDEIKGLGAGHHPFRKHWDLSRKYGSSGIEVRLFEAIEATG